MWMKYFVSSLLGPRYRKGGGAGAAVHFSALLLCTCFYTQKDTSSLYRNGLYIILLRKSMLEIFGGCVPI